MALLSGASAGGWLALVLPKSLGKMLTCVCWLPFSQALRDKNLTLNREGDQGRCFSLGERSSITPLFFFNGIFLSPAALANFSLLC